MSERKAGLACSPGLTPGSALLHTWRMSRHQRLLSEEPGEPLREPGLESSSSLGQEGSQGGKAELGRAWGSAGRVSVSLAPPGSMASLQTCTAPVLLNVCAVVRGSLCLLRLFLLPLYRKGGGMNPREFLQFTDGDLVLWGRPK